MSEILKRFARLGLLLAAQRDATVAESGPRVGRALKRFLRRAFHRELEDAGTIGIEPEFGLRRSFNVIAQGEFRFGDVDGTEWRQHVEVEPVGRMLGIKRTLLL